LVGVESTKDPGNKRLEEEEKDEDEEKRRLEGERRMVGVLGAREGHASSSDISGLGGREACIMDSSCSMRERMSLLSALVILSMARRRGRRGEEEEEGGEEWEEEEQEEGEGVSLWAVSTQPPVSRFGLRAVRTLEAATREGERPAMVGWELDRHTRVWALGLVASIDQARSVFNSLWSMCSTKSGAITADKSQSSLDSNRNSHSSKSSKDTL